MLDISIKTGLKFHVIRSKGFLTTDFCLNDPEQVTYIAMYFKII